MTGTVSAAVPDIIRDAREDWREPLADRRESAVCQESLASTALESKMAEDTGGGDEIEAAADSGGICGDWPEMAVFDRDGFPKSRARGVLRGFLRRIGLFFNIPERVRNKSAYRSHLKNSRVYILWPNPRKGKALDD